MILHPVASSRSFLRGSGIGIGIVRFVVFAGRCSFRAVFLFCFCCCWRLTTAISTFLRLDRLFLGRGIEDLREVVSLELLEAVIDDANAADVLWEKPLLAHEGFCSSVKRGITWSKTPVSTHSASM